MAYNSKGYITAMKIFTVVYHYGWQGWKWIAIISSAEIGHFTVVCVVTWPLSGSEAGGNLVLIQTPLLFTCKSCCSHAN